MTTTAVATKKDQENIVLRYVEPRIDILENKDEFLLIVDLPGVSKEDLDVQIEPEHLLVEGKRRRPEGQKGSERFWNVNYQRKFKIGKNIDFNNIEAKLGKDGKLLIHLPKAPEIKSRKINVKTL